MTTLKPFIVLALAATIAVSGCAKKDRKLMNLRATGRGPDEFAILPTKPLPEPTLGGTNLTDPTPRADAVAALGGRPKVLNREGISTAETGVVQISTRYGVAGDIRPTLTAEDKEFRLKNPPRLLERLFGITTYYKVYEPQSLDRYAELRRLRRAGVKTPAAPPAP
jgi:hypothetical protein